jgi:hypothetical protein
MPASSTPKVNSFLAPQARAQRSSWTAGAGVPGKPDFGFLGGGASASSAVKSLCLFNLPAALKP